mgnify:CR=1 FL=1|jgi:hypothetical protein|tara:strand:+ start:471 stop:959 length:489 start_codon:yes stop_codon:yes gene_type:complete
MKSKGKLIKSLNQTLITIISSIKGINPKIMKHYYIHLENGELLYFLSPTSDARYIPIGKHSNREDAQIAANQKLGIAAMTLEVKNEYIMMLKEMADTNELLRIATEDLVLEMIFLSHKNEEPSSLSVALDYATEFFHEVPLSDRIPSEYLLHQAKELLKDGE